MHKEFPVQGIEFPLAEEVPTVSEEGCHCQKKREATARKIALLSKSRRNCQSKSYDIFTNAFNLFFYRSAKTQFQIIFVVSQDTTNGETGKKSGRTVTLTAKDMQKKKNDVKARTTLLLSLPDEHQLAPKSQDRARRDNYIHGYKAEEQALKTLMAIDGVGWDWSYMANDEENHALVADEVAPTEFALMANTSAESKKLETLNQEKEGVDGKLASLLTASKDLDNLIESQRADKNKEGLGYNAVPPPPAQIYSSLKKDLSWTGLLEFANDTVTDYSRPSPTMESTSSDDQHRNPFVSETIASPITPKPFIKFMKPKDNQSKKCIVLGRDFKLLDDANILLRTPRQHNMYSIDLNNIVLHKDLMCLVSKASVDECMLWHRRLGHLNFKTMNKLVRHNLVRGLPTKCFENDHTCTACLKGKQHKASLADDFSRFTWTFFLKTKDETSGILRNFIIDIENLKELKVKIIKCDNGGEFRNKEMNDFCLRKWIKREFSNARTPQQNGVAERRNRTLIEAARTMLADAKLPVTFWAEAVNTVCYIQNRVLVNKSQNKTLYELFNGRTPVIGFLKPFGCYVMILNTLDTLGKFDAKGDEGYLIGYSMSSKPFRVFNKRTKRVEENLHVDFLKNKAIEKGTRPNWLFDIDSLNKSINYVPVVVADTNSTNLSGTKDATSQEVKKDVSSLRHIALPNWVHDALLESPSSNAQDTCKADAPESSEKPNPTTSTSNPSADQIMTLTVETPIPTISSPVLTACFKDSPEPTTITRIISKRVTSQDETPSLDTISTLVNRFEHILKVTTNSVDSDGVEADVSNMETTIIASPTPIINSMATNEDSSAAGSKPITLFIRTRPAESKIQATLLGLNSTFLFVEKIIKDYTGQRPTHIQEACFEHTKKCFEDRVIPFLDIFKIHVMHCEVTWFNEATEFNKIFDELDNAYAKCYADNQSLYAMNKRNIAKNKSLQIQKKNLLIHDESLIADCIAKDVCSIVLASEREDILGLLNVGSIESSFESKALETEITQLKEGLTSIKIQNDGYKVTNTNLNKCYQELSKANTHLRTTSLEKIATQKAEIATLKAEAVGKKNSGPTGTPTKSKVLAPGITSPRSIQKPPVQHKKPTVPVNMFPKAKPTTETRKQFPRETLRTIILYQLRVSKRGEQRITTGIFTRIVPIWKPTGRRFNLHDIFGLRTSTEPIIKPSELTPCVSPSTNATLSLEPILEPIELSLSVSSCASSTITMVSRFSDYRLSDRKAGSNGISSVFY
nr:hypothetical protein [Tanacetum cinerariifolium]